MEKFRLRFCWLVVLVVLFCAHAHATTLVIQSGRLKGADNVLVGNRFYNVDFVEGTCVSVFSGCTSFAFSTATTASRARAALLGQVFLDGVLGNFDSNPTLTFGCIDPTHCLVQTPYSANGVSVNYAFAANYDNPVADYVGFASHSVLTIDTSSPTDAGGSPDSVVWGIWTPVPEPSSLALLVAPFGCLVFLRLFRSHKSNEGVVRQRSQ